MVKKKKSSDKLKALMRTQELNEFLERSTIESEALQNVGDDRPSYESHVFDLLEKSKGTAKQKKSAKGKKH
ncbi:MAG: hypothetical protein M1122_02125 [Candidatus Marsarchaeota archaeon]|nr:hypothetical protein [Candidatus Marsarchaeota archaeon]